MSAILRPDTSLVAGVDEAGRGPLAGPVVVAAVILDPERRIDGLADSKILGERQRDRLFDCIRADALTFSIVVVDIEEIERRNILQATLAGMGRALESLDPAPVHALIDGNQRPRSAPCDITTVVDGDAMEPAIMAASILAKVTRDRLLIELDRLHPGYGFSRHKGYPTPEHLAALERLGPSPVHRRSFAPVRRILERGLFN